MFTNLLISLCTIQEKTLSTVGYEQIEAWSDVAINVACRKDTPNRVKISDSEIRENNDDILFFLDPAVEIQRGNRIVFEGEYYDVININQSYDSVTVHHLEVIARFTDNS